MQIDRRDFLKMAGVSAGALALGAFPLKSMAQARAKELNILCWEGYNSDVVLDPFRKMTGATVKAEAITADPDAVNKLRAGEVKVWDLINVNNPWARYVLYPEGLIKPLDRARFEPYFDKMMPIFKAPYTWAMSQDGKDLLGMVQRFGPYSFVVNTDKISRKMAEDQGFDLFNDDGMSKRYGMLLSDDWNVYHTCIGAGVNPFKEHTAEEFAAYEKTARKWIGGVKLMTGDISAINLALINGEIDAYITGGNYTVSPARMDGHKNIRGITPARGPINGKGGLVWVEVTSVVNNPVPSPLAEQFLEYVQQPETSKTVAFAEGTYNPVAQMGDPKVLAMFDADELDAIQWDSLEEEMSRCDYYNINPDFNRMLDILNAAKREAKV